MNNQSLANKYRPGVFADILGQEAAVKSLQGKLSESRLPRTMLFFGAHGSGKTTLARIVGKAVNCQHPKEDGNPCGKCESCRSIDAGISTDVIELDAASHNKVEDAEQIIRQASFLPAGKVKVIILDEFHMMTKEAQNKLLKVVEEPPEHVIFIFCTTEENRILPTILSRCNKFTFRGINDADILGNLKRICEAEGFDYEEDALKLIVKSADGHVRDSLSILEQLSYEKLTAQRVIDTLGIATHDQVFLLLQAVAVQDVKGIKTFLDDVFSFGNIQSFLKEVVYILCYLLTFNDKVEDGETEDFRQQVSSLAVYFTPERSLAFIKQLTRALQDNRGMGIEMATTLAFLSMVTEMKKEDRISALEAEIVHLKELLENASGISNNNDDARQVSGPVSTMEQMVMPSVEVDPEPKPMEQAVETSFIPTEVTWPEEIPFNDAGDGFEPIPTSEIGAVLGMEEATIADITPMQNLSAPVSTPVQEPSLTIPGGVIASEKGLPVSTEKSSASADNSFSIPGGVIVTSEATEERSEEVKEAPVTGGFSDAGFGNSFSGGLFGSTGVRFF